MTPFVVPVKTGVRESWMPDHVGHDKTTLSANTVKHRRTRVNLNYHDTPRKLFSIPREL